MKFSGGKSCMSKLNNQLSCKEKIYPYLIAPGSMVTSAAAISVEIVKVLESTILTVPPLSCVGCTFENEKANGLGMTPFGLTTSVALSEGGTYRTVVTLMCKFRKKVKQKSFTAWKDIKLLRRDMSKGGDVPNDFG